jgi:hypothetical protein
MAGTVNREGRLTSRMLKNDSSHRRRPVSRKPRLSKINEFLDAGLRRHDEIGWINEFFNSLLSLGLRFDS